MYAKTESKSRITKDTFILLMGLFYPAIHNYIWRIIVAITGSVGFYFTIETFDAIVWILVIGYIVLTSRKPTISVKTLMISILFISITLLCFVLTDYEYFSVSVLFALLIGTFSFFMQGSFVNLKRVSHKQLYIAAIITLIISILYSVYSIDSKEISLEDNMDFAYKVLPSILIIFSWLFTAQKKKLAIAFSVIGTFFLLLQGTRGPLFCLACFVCLMIYKKQGMGKLFFKVGAILLITVLMISSPIVQLKLVELTEKIDSVGYSSRFITMMLEGELSDGNGREAIQETLLEEIKDNPFKIRGMFADRQATRGLVDTDYNNKYEKGTYAHSLWIEIIYDWGVLFGGIILIALFFVVCKLVVKSDSDDAYIVMLFVCTGFIHLFLSGSYLQSAPFFFLIGIALNYHVNAMKRERAVSV